MNDGLDLGDLYIVCVYGRKAQIYTSWTDSNLRKQFWGCTNYRGDLKSRYFRWFDPLICARSKQIIHGLLRRLRELEMRLGKRLVFKSNCLLDLLGELEPDWFLNLLENLQSDWLLDLLKDLEPDLIIDLVEDLHSECFLILFQSHPNSLHLFFHKCSCCALLFCT
ncbi:hypothetical protein QYF36_005914 [Acer negundo]|nr:hypothetical protein QYF36_005914 [Acer negundo]